MTKKLLILSSLLLGLVTLGPTAEAPADASAQLQQAEALAKNGQYEQAEAIYQPIVRDDPGSDYAFEAQEKLTCLYVTWDKEPQAEAALQQLLSDFSGHNDIAAALWRIAKQYGQAKKYQKADQIHQYNVDNFPDDMYAMKSQAEIVFSHIRDDDDAAAEAAVNDLLSIFSEQPTLPTEVYQVAREYEKFKKYDKAFDLYQYDVGNFPEDMHAMMSQTGIAKCHIREGNDAAADAAFDKLLSMFAGQPTLHEQIHYVARKYEEFEKYDKALELYQYNVDSFPNDEYTMRSQVRIVRTHILTGNEAAADVAFDKLLTLFSDQPTLPEEVYKIANKFGEAKNIQKAHQLYEYVIDRWSSNVDFDSRKFVVMSHIALADDRAASAGLDTLIADFPDHSHLPGLVFQIGEQYYDRAFRNEKAGLRAETRDCFIKAIAVWERIIAELPESGHAVAQAYNFAAICYRRIGQYDVAIQYFQMVVDHYPDYEYAPYAQFIVGRIYQTLMKAGRLTQPEAYQGMRQAYGNVLSRYPDSEWAGRAQGQLQRFRLINRTSQIQGEDK